ncbi:hypothetical protein [Natrinema halophilum]|uniref:Uncharacterized protein n=1 Tax=Natrinema halophilum TaxID=1699371 RepID=A0A7D5GJ39_9EURY|nr:hypothetical protein [Natrinema halophilum]QLG48050.1 hypothetical protein HYG82_03910 [Natrinema halophilum]
MSVTVDLNNTEAVNLTENTIDQRPPDRLEFTVEGRLVVNKMLLEGFAGATLDPVQVTVSTDASERVTINLTGPPTLRLETTDVGVATPEMDDIGTEIDAFRSPANDDPGGIDSPPNVVAFTVDGTIRDVPAATIRELPNRALRFESVSFAVEESVSSDGGSRNDIIVEFSLLGYGIVVRRDGTIVLASDGTLTRFDPF